MDPSAGVLTTYAVCLPRKQKEPWAQKEPTENLINWCNWLTSNTPVCSFLFVADSTSHTHSLQGKLGEGVPMLPLPVTWQGASPGGQIKGQTGRVVTATADTVSGSRCVWSGGWEWGQMEERCSDLLGPCLEPWMGMGAGACGCTVR